MGFNFKKSCFECGAKVSLVYDGKCEACFKASNPPIVEVKPINVKYCNICKKLNYNNSFFKRDEFEKRLPFIIKKNIVLDKQYKLNEIITNNLKFDNDRVSFDIEVDCDLK